jgi:hypothetical protein
MGHTASMIFDATITWDHFSATITCDTMPWDHISIRMTKDATMTYIAQCNNNLHDMA